MDLRAGRRVVRALLLLGGLALCFVACGGDEDTNAATPTLSELESEIFGRSCAFSTCHAGGSPAGDLNLESPVYDKIVNVDAFQQPTLKRVVPGSPIDSYLFVKLTEANPPTGDQMPPSQPLAADRIEKVRAWIEAGAKND